MGNAAIGSGPVISAGNVIRKMWKAAEGLAVQPLTIVSKIVVTITRVECALDLRPCMTIGF